MDARNLVGLVVTAALGVAAAVWVAGLSDVAGAANAVGIAAVAFTATGLVASLAVNRRHFEAVTRPASYVLLAGVQLPAAALAFTSGFGWLALAVTLASASMAVVAFRASRVRTAQPN